MVRGVPSVVFRHNLISHPPKNKDVVMHKTLGVLLYEQVQPLDVIGPWEVFAMWKNILGAPLQLCLIAETHSYITCDNDIVLKAHMDFTQAPPLDYLLIPGGRGRLNQVNHAPLIAFIQQQAVHCQYILSVCTGAFLLQAAGLLHEKSATTYWRALPELTAFHDTRVLEERIVKSGKIWTAGGVSSGIDLALALIATVAGQETAGQVQLLLEYFPPNTRYCQKDTIHTLPPYRQGRGEIPAPLPAYIKKYLESR